MKRILVCGLVALLPLLAGVAHATDAEAPGVVQKVGSAIERGAKAAASGVERGASAAVRGVKTGVEAAARGVERGAQATARAADKVAGKVQGGTAPSKPAGSTANPSNWPPDRPGHAGS